MSEMFDIVKEGGLRKIDAAKDNTRPLISIITTTYNAEQYIIRCIASVQAQAFKNIEHIILDGASTDNTVAILEAHNSILAYWRSEKDEGIYDAMNKAIKYARGDWYLFLGADDELLDGFSEMALLLKQQNCIYYGDFVFDTMRRAGGKFDGYRLAKAGICHQNIFYPAIVFKKYLYNKRYPLYADYFLNIQCWADKSIKFEYHPLVIAKFCSDGVSSTSIDIQFEKDRKSIIKKYLGQIVYWRYLIRKLRKKESNKRIY